jgi:hypothetical protein
VHSYYNKGPARNIFILVSFSFACTEEMDIFFILPVLISFCLASVTSIERKTGLFEDDMYANLLMRAVSGSLYPFDTRLPHIVDNGFPLQTYDFEKRKYGLDWPIIGHTMIGWVRLQNIYNAVRTCELEDVTGDFVEAGNGKTQS